MSQDNSLMRVSAFRLRTDWTLEEVNDAERDHTKAAFQTINHLIAGLGLKSRITIEFNLSCEMRDVVTRAEEHKDDGSAFEVLSYNLGQANHHSLIFLERSQFPVECQECDGVASSTTAAVANSYPEIIVHEVLHLLGVSDGYPTEASRGDRPCPAQEHSCCFMQYEAKNGHTLCGVHKSELTQFVMNKSK